MPENRISDLLRPTKATDGYIFHHRVERLSLTGGHHLSDHRRMDDARTDRVDADALRSTFESSAFSRFLL